jgi:hypothetical protein
MNNTDKVLAYEQQMDELIEAGQVALAKYEDEPSDKTRRAFEESCNRMVTIAKEVQAYIDGLGKDNATNC